MPDHVEFSVTYNGTKTIATVSKEDWPWVSRYTWTASDNGSKSGNIYVYRKIRNEDGTRRKSYLHHEVMDAMGAKPDTGQIRDHVNRDTLLNTRDNLRIADRTGNIANRGSARTYKGRPCTSKYKGVSRVRRTGKWQASIGFRYKNYYLGSFVNKEDAARAYDSKARELFGDCAWLNFPPEDPAKAA